MEAGIIGLPNVGKSTLFNALTNAHADAANYPFCTVEPNSGMIPVPDQRLAVLDAHFQRGKSVPAILRVVDIAGLVEGASKGEGLGNRFLANIREVDALLHVVRCFEESNVAHVSTDLDPIHDIETVETELLVADLESAEGALAKAQSKARKNDSESAARVGVLKQCMEALSDGIPIRSVKFSDPEDKQTLRSLGMLTAKRVMYVANVDENDLHGESITATAVKQYAADQGAGVVCISAEIEAEVRELNRDDQREMLDSLGLNEPALHTVIHAAYGLLELISFFTVGEKEVRAWTIPRGFRAPQAAGVIHTDFERGFIRAEVYRVEDLKEHGSEAAIRAAGKLRVEGKDYVVQDGDVCKFLFNV